jgi:hypothetical protein
LPGVLHPSDYPGRERMLLIAPRVSKRHSSRARGHRVSGKIPRTPTRFAMVLVMGVGITLAWQSYGVETARAWAPSLGWLLPASPSSPAVTSAELQQQLKPVAIDLALVRRSEEQLTTNQDQLARKQDQMAQAIARLQAAQQDLSQQILALAPSAQKAVHVAPKQVQPPAQ